MPDSRHGKLHLRKFKRLFKCSEMVGVPVLPVFTQNAVLHQNSWTQVVLWIPPQNICESLKACLSSRPTDLSVSVPLFHNSGGVLPVRWARSHTASAEDALIHPIQLGPILASMSVHTRHLCASHTVRKCKKYQKALCNKKVWPNDIEGYNI